MKRQRSIQPPRKMQNIYLIIYEGDTEGEYISFLRKQYKSSVKIKAFKEGTKISKNSVRKITDSLKLDKKDTITTFLMYDEDVESINKKLEEIDGIKLLSNPCFEVWYLMHMTSKLGYMSSDDCNRKLKLFGEPWNNYSKGNLTDKQKVVLWDKRDTACCNARKLR